MIFLLAAAAALSAVPISETTTRLDDIGIYHVGYTLRRGASAELPLGWSGSFDDGTGVACKPAGVQKGKKAFLLHCPWRNGTGASFQEFQLDLPKAKWIELSFSVALETSAVGKSDGVIFGVEVNGEPLARQHKKDDDWQEFHLDLTRYAGQTIRLRFECDCGPNDNSSFDFAIWGDRMLKVAGLDTPLSQPSRKKPLAALTGLLNRSESLTPSVSGRFQNSVRKNEFVCDGEDGKLSYRIEATPRFLEGITLATPAGTLPIAYGANLLLAAPDGRLVRSDDPQVEAKLVDVQSAEPDRPLTIHQRFTLAGKSADVKTAYSLAGKTLSIHVSSDDPVIAEVDFGHTALAMFRRPVGVPYLGTVYWFPHERLFGRTQLDWTVSKASSHRDNVAFYGKLTDGTRQTLHETALITLASDAREVFPNIPNPSSPFRGLLADKVMLDIWDGKYADDAAWLRELASYRIGPFQIIKHVWQNGGYDNKLPNVLPAHAGLGGDAGMKEFVDTAKQLGHIVSLHENYADFYPNSAAWNTNDVGREANGEFIKAWFNEGIKTQSYAFAPNAIVGYAREFSTQVRDRFHINAMYLDVHSSVPPWFHVDFNAKSPGAGQFKSVWVAHRDLWALERELFSGPVFGEGNEHWRWSGLLDGVEAQFGTGWPESDAESAPLLVDFDLLKIHPLQFNHGMGYYERWLVGGMKAPRDIPQIKLDQYRMQEIAYGHAGFIGAQAWRRAGLAHVWQESALMHDVQKRYAAVQVRDIRYELGGELVPLTDALAAGSPLNRVRIAYENGLTIWCNGSQEVWSVKLPSGVLVLPQFGWVATGAGLTAWTAWRDGIVADFSQTDRRIFANARTTPAMQPSQISIRPTVAANGFEAGTNRSFKLTINWQARQKLSKNYNRFLHFTDRDGHIVFQADGALPKPTSAWSANETITDGPQTIPVPNGIPNGNYLTVVGLFTNEGRLDLDGVKDGESRVILGTLTIAENGAKLSFSPETAAPKDTGKIFAEHVNVKRERVEFGALATDGSILMEKDKDGSWLLTPFPREEKFTVALSGHSVEALDSDIKPLQKTPVQRVGSRIEFEVGLAGAAHYRVR